MAKFTNATVLDAALQEIIDNCDLMVACTGLPTTFLEATTTMKLADIARVPGDFTGPGDGTAGGSREITVEAVADVTIDVTGTAINVALLDSTAGTAGAVLHVAECTSLMLIGAQKVNFPDWKIIFLQPT